LATYVIAFQKWYVTEWSLPSVSVTVVVSFV